MIGVELFDFDLNGAFVSLGQNLDHSIADRGSKKNDLVVREEVKVEVADGVDGLVMG